MLQVWSFCFGFDVVQKLEDASTVIKSYNNQDLDEEILIQPMPENEVNGVFSIPKHVS